MDEDIGSLLPISPRVGLTKPLELELELVPVQVQLPIDRAVGLIDWAVGRALDGLRPCHAVPRVVPSLHACCVCHHHSTAGYAAGGELMRFG